MGTANDTKYRTIFKTQRKKTVKIFNKITLQVSHQATDTVTLSKMARQYPQNQIQKSYKKPDRLTY